MMDKIASPITTIPGIGRNMGAMIISEIGDFSRFSSPDKILAYAGFSPSIYQSGKLDNCYAHMEKTWFTLFALRIVSCCETCMPLGQNFCRLLSEKTC